MCVYRAFVFTSSRPAKIHAQPSVNLKRYPEIDADKNHMAASHIV